MRLLSLSCESFRNLKQVKVTPSPRTTIAVGENGQGKTNLLEALYYLATLKPLRTLGFSWIYFESSRVMKSCDAVCT